MKLEWMALANYAEDRDGLLYIVGGAWDTINVQAPMQVEGPGAAAYANVFAVMQGMLVIRLLLNSTDIGVEHKVLVQFVDEDGQEVATAEGDFRAEKNPGLPLGWDQGSNIVLSLTGIPVPKPGNFTINLHVDGDFLGDRPFRVLKLY